MKKTLLGMVVLGAMSLVHASWFGLVEDKPVTPVTIYLEGDSPQSRLNEAFWKLKARQISTADFNKSGTLFKEPLKTISTDLFSLDEGNGSVDGTITVLFVNKEATSTYYQEYYAGVVHKSLMEALGGFAAFQTRWERSPDGQKLILTSPVLDYFNLPLIASKFQNYKPYTLVNDPQQADYRVHLKLVLCNDKLGRSIMRGELDPSLQPKKGVSNQGVGSTIANAGGNSYLATPSGSNSGSAVLMGAGLAIGAIEWLLTSDNKIYDETFVAITMTVTSKEGKSLTVYPDFYIEKRLVGTRLDERGKEVLAYRIRNTIVGAIKGLQDKIEKEAKVQP